MNRSDNKLLNVLNEVINNSLTTMKILQMELNQEGRHSLETESGRREGRHSLKTESDRRESSSSKKSHKKSKSSDFNSVTATNDNNNEYRYCPSDNSPRGVFVRQKECKANTEEHDPCNSKCMIRSPLNNTEDHDPRNSKRMVRSQLKKSVYQEETSTDEEFDNDNRKTPESDDSSYSTLFTREYYNSTNSSLANNTRRQYNLAIKVWFKFCQEKNISVYKPSVLNIIEFFEKVSGTKKRSTIYSYRSALKLIFKNESMNDAKIKRFFKDVFNQSNVRNFPRNFVHKTQCLKNYTHIVDAPVIFKHVSEMGKTSSLCLEDLSKKLLVLMKIATGQKMKILANINVENIIRGDELVKIKINDNETSTPLVLKLPFFYEKPNLCVASILGEYLQETEKCTTKKSEFLFLSYIKPYHSCTSQTLNRWIEDILYESGIDTEIEKNHYNCLLSKCSKAKKRREMKLIRKVASRSKNYQAFIDFYHQ